MSFCKDAPRIIGEDILNLTKLKKLTVEIEPRDYSDLDKTIFILSSLKSLEHLRIYRYNRDSLLPINHKFEKLKYLEKGGFHLNNNIDFLFPNIESINYISIK